MSDAEVEAPAVVAAAPGEPMDIYQALQEVLKTALIHDGLSRGAKEATKSLDKREAHLCVLANNVDEPLYSKLIEALCNEHGINLLKVDDSKKLGEWAGLCKLDKEGKARKVNSCGCVVVKVDDSKKLGEWAGLCKLDKEGKARKVNSCGCVVVKVTAVSHSLCRS
ncbi:hypothetical protein EGW08_022411 [Elysia chlorotica]|uniref:40S ribosomal protein S12 n=1 Tax=Elysia chlorotica TaxID=188477 RepID=A0A3S0Z5K3_ELYCH|nr:hypothetical protein EGW08_022411 [Elysia chlorotica]